MFLLANFFYWQVLSVSHPTAHDISRHCRSDCFLRGLNEVSARLSGCMPRGLWILLFSSGGELSCLRSYSSVVMYRAALSRCDEAQWQNFQHESPAPVQYDLMLISLLSVPMSISTFLHVREAKSEYSAFSRQCIYPIRSSRRNTQEARRRFLLLYYSSILSTIGRLLSF